MTRSGTARYMLAIAYIAILLGVFREAVLAIRSLQVTTPLWGTLFVLLVTSSLIFALVEKSSLPLWRCQILAVIVCFLSALAIGFTCAVLIIIAANLY